MIKKVRKASRIVAHRLRTQGLKKTILWAYARGVPKLTGVPPLRYSQITPQIYVGPQYGKRGKRVLEKAGIHSAVNLRQEFDDAAHGLALDHYLYLPTVDETPPSLEDLRQAAHFIQTRVAAGDKVYIHCAGGVGRAPTTAAAYFITQDMTSAEALELIQKARPFIDVLPHQLMQLVEFENQQA